MYVYLARVAGVAQEAPALTLNRLCGSGLQAIVSAAQSILLGHADIAVGAGCQTARNAENFSASHWLLHVNGSVAISVLVKCPGCAAGWAPRPRC
jgi:acetyl-CoA acetyltransferase